jgi:hypothetical protein
MSFHEPNAGQQQWPRFQFGAQISRRSRHPEIALHTASQN